MLAAAVGSSNVVVPGIVGHTLTLVGSKLFVIGGMYWCIGNLSKFPVLIIYDFFRYLYFIFDVVKLYFHYFFVTQKLALFGVSSNYELISYYRASQNEGDNSFRVQFARNLYGVTKEK